MNKQLRAILYFFFSQNFSDGLLTTAGILLPSLIMSQFNQLNLGILLSLGALNASITDIPGPTLHKRNGMLICCLTIFVVALITVYLRAYPWLMALEIGVFSFIFSLFAIYGNRAASVGVTGILVMIMMMGLDLEPGSELLNSSLILAGGIWYTLLSLLLIRIRPYKQTQQALGECVHEVANFMRLRGNFYKFTTHLEENYRQLVPQQVKVSEKQDAVRELLFKSRLLVTESTTTSRQLLLTFREVVDLYEQIMLIHSDYATIRQRFGTTGLLNEISKIIHELAEELDAIGLMIQSNIKYNKRYNFKDQLLTLQAKIEAAKKQHPGQDYSFLDRTRLHLLDLSKRIHNIAFYYNSEAEDTTLPRFDPARFVSHQEFDLKKLRDNLTLESGIFKFSIRVVAACLAGYAITQLFDFGHHSYWVLLTIIVILKPAFSLTRQRNWERLMGTVAGGLIGIFILLLFPDQQVRLALLVVFMIGCFSFIRVNYIISVIFMTPFVLILFSFMGNGEFMIVQERIIDTLLGSAIAFAVSYLVFPSWEAEQLHKHMQAVLKANFNYLQKLVTALSGSKIGEQEYKLARKEVYISSANLSAAFQRMLSEPKSKQTSSKDVHRFVVLNHILSSYIAATASTINLQKAISRNTDLLQNSLNVLADTIRKFDPEFVSTASLQMPELPASEKDELQESWELIQKVSCDIKKNTEAVLE